MEDPTGEERDRAHRGRAEAAGRDLRPELERARRRTHQLRTEGRAQREPGGSEHHDHSAGHASGVGCLPRTEGATGLQVGGIERGVLTHQHQAAGLDGAPDPPCRAGRWRRSRPLHGSGSTGIAAVAAGNHYIGFELAPLFYKETQKRFEGEFLDEGLAFTPGKAQGVSYMASGPLPTAIKPPSFSDCVASYDEWCVEFTAAMEQPEEADQAVQKAATETIRPKAKSTRKKKLVAV